MEINKSEKRFGWYALPSNELIFEFLKRNFTTCNLSPFLSCVLEAEIWQYY